MSVMASRPVLRWAVPAGVVALVLGGGALATTLTASADAQLPARSAAQLLADVASARLEGVSGTVVEQADLGLPGILGGLGGGGGPSASSDLNSLVAGTHTLKVWYSGQDKARIALLGATSETDVVYNGKDAWLWSSAKNEAAHFTVPAGGPRRAGPPKALPSDLPSDLPKTPQDAADKILALVSPTTSVSVDGSTVVAGHPAYQLVVAPKDTASLVAEIRVAIDGTAHVPTRVQVFAKGQDKPAFEIGFTQVSFARPDNGVFTFNPPPGVKITEGATGGAADGAKKPAGAPGTPPAPNAPPKTAVVGKGWTAILVARMPADTSAPKTGKGSGPDLKSLLTMLPQVHGAFGSGRMLESHLFSVLVTDDGRILVGAVKPERLIAAASDPAAALK
jgi:outer membrane lipoprotein-sorting protein